MNIIDIHTHHDTAQQALISTSPDIFSPKEGCYYSLGIHPWNTLEPFELSFDRLHALARHRQVIAIGETGLDALRGAPLDVQLALFKQHLELACEVNKPLIVHCVKAWQPLIKAWRETVAHDQVKMAIHGFRGNINVAQTLINEGFYLSFGPKYNPETLLATPSNRLLLETDDSTTTIEDVVVTVAKSLGVTPSSLMVQATNNARTFLGCDKP
ncbi:MAG: TatD family hydrolase [Muribaculaceae bacterium]|nr:TatD family hydrolase [Muribaculaceae bacterium]